VVEGDRIIKTLGGAASKAAGLKGVAIEVAERPVLKHLYLEAETSVLSAAEGTEIRPVSTPRTRRVP
jgi:hypothetical protein